MQPAYERLAAAPLADRVVREQDQACARPVDGNAAVNDLAQLLKQPVAARHDPHRRRFAPREHQPLHAIDLRRHADLPRPGPKALQHFDVLLHRPLQRQHADQRLLARHALHKANTHSVALEKVAGTNASSAFCEVSSSLMSSLRVSSASANLEYLYMHIVALLNWLSKLPFGSPRAAIRKACAPSCARGRGREVYPI